MGGTLPSLTFGWRKTFTVEGPHPPRGTENSDSDAVLIYLHPDIEKFEDIQLIKSKCWLIID